MHTENLIFAIAITILFILQYRTNKNIERVELKNSIQKHKETCPGYICNERRKDDVEIIGTDRRGED